MSPYSVLVVVCVVVLGVAADIERLPGEQQLPQRPLYQFDDDGVHEEVMDLMTLDRDLQQRVMAQLFREEAAAREEQYAQQREAAATAKRRDSAAKAMQYAQQEAAANAERRDSAAKAMQYAQQEAAAKAVQYAQQQAAAKAERRDSAAKAEQYAQQEAAANAERDEPVASLGQGDNDFDFAVGPDDPEFDGLPSNLQDPPTEEFTNIGGDSDIELDDDASPSDSLTILPRIDPPPHAQYIGEELTPMTFIAIVAACSLGGIVIVAIMGILTYRLQKNAKAAADVEYPAYGITGPSKDVSPTTADRRLAQSAHMYHYQHQKQQIIQMERSSSERRGSVSDPESDDDNEEGDYTVYECPGLASTGDMEVKNPLFLDDPTPASPAQQAAETQDLPK